MFDLDGTLLDTLPLHYRAYSDVLSAYGLDLSFEDYRRNAASPARISIPRFIEAARGDPERLPPVGVLHSAKKTRLAAILVDAQPQRLPTAAVLEAVRDRKPTALVTSAAASGVELILATQGWREAFDVIVCGDDVTQGKPDPEPYLLAARRLGVTAQGCLVFEDASEGVASALAADMTVVDVTNAGGSVGRNRAAL